MKIVSVVAVVLALGTSVAQLLPPRSPLDSRPLASSSQLWLDAPIDHTNTSVGSFKIRYYVNDEFWKKDLPLSFFVMGGEGPANGIGQGYVYALAEKYGALLVQTEHRYYGESIPGGFPDGYARDNLVYLTVEQALADVALLIDTVDGHFKGSKARTFTFGGSYSGALSAWFRVAYPGHTLGSLSSSGVVNAIEDFVGFDAQVAEALDNQGSCKETLEATTGAFDHDFDINGGKLSRELFGVRHDLPAADFFYMLADGTAMADQYGGKTRLCAAMKAIAHGASNITLMSTVASFIKDFWGKDFPNTCFYDTKCVTSGPSSRWRGGTDRMWRWQKCTETAYLQSAPSHGSIRSTRLTIDVLLQQCKDAFGVVPDTAKLNDAYGGATPKGTRIFFSDFSDDPWQRASVTQEINDSLPFSLVTCDDCGHCMDLHMPSANDPAPLAASRERFETYLEQWIK